MFLRTRKQPIEHPLVDPRKSVRNVLALVITSDRGLCGGFNSNLNRKVAGWLAENRSRWERVQLSFCGRRGFLFFRNTADVWMNFEGISAKPLFTDVRRLVQELEAAFMTRRYDEIYVAYTSWNGGMSQSPVIERLLPLSLPAAPAAGGASGPYWLLEPNRGELLHALLGRLVTLKVYTALLSSAVCEHMSRMTAMESATTNAENLIETYTLMRNRARQAAITGELIEIIAGAEALK